MDKLQLQVEYRRTLDDYRKKSKHLGRLYDELVATEKDCRFGVGKARGMSLQERRSILNYAKLAHSSALRKANRSKEIHLAIKRKYYA